MTVHRLVLVLMLLLSPLIVAQGSEPLSDLAQLRWKQRVIVATANALADGDAETVSALLAASTREIEDRDILWFVIAGDHVVTNYVGSLAGRVVNAAELQAVLADGNVALIGKDGGVKARSERLDLEALFATIDGMPMRRAEVRQRRITE